MSDTDGPFSDDAERAAEDQWVSLVDATTAAVDKLLLAALRVLSGRLDDREHAHAADEAQYAQELLALAARELTRATDALPASQQPVGWTDAAPGHAGTLDPR